VANLKQVTLTTDFGTRDGYAAVMKGVIWTIAPDTTILDITHDVAPQNIFEGAQTLKRTVPFFPPGSVHIGVIDPGVGTHRRPIAVRLGERFLVGPDNGLFWLLIEQERKNGTFFQAIELNQPRFWLAEISSSFHGRDIFAPVGAHLVNGVALEALGSSINDLVELIIPQPQRTPSGWLAEVIHSDSFGNLATNIEREHIPAGAQVEIHVAGQRIHGVSRAYADRDSGAFVALFDSDGLLSLAVVNGSAANVLKASVGTKVEVCLDEVGS